MRSRSLLNRFLLALLLVAASAVPTGAVALTYTVNQAPATSAITIHTLKTALVARGWVVKASGDGGNACANGVCAAGYSATTGDCLTGGGAGACGLDNNQSWFRIQDPATVRELVFHRTADGTQYWRVAYSANAKFTGGAPSTSQTPTATDRVMLAGTTDDTGAAASGYALFTSLVEGNYYAQIGASTGAPWGFWLIAYAAAGNPVAVVSLDPCASGTTATGDTDAAVLYVYGGGSLFQSDGNVFDGHGTQSPRSWLAVPSATTTNFVATPAMRYHVTAGNMTDGLGVNPFTSRDDLLPIIYARRVDQTAPRGYKCVSTMYQWRTKVRVTTDTVGVSALKDHVYWDQVASDWDGVTVPSP